MHPRLTAVTEQLRSARRAIALELQWWVQDKKSVMLCNQSRSFRRGLYNAHPPARLVDWRSSRASVVMAWPLATEREHFRIACIA